MRLVHASCFVGVLALWQWSTVAQACSCFEDANQFYMDTPGLLPANAIGLGWRVTGGMPTARISMWRIDGKKETPLDVQLIPVQGAGLFVAPSDGYVAGARYRVRSAESEARRRTRQSYESRGEALPDYLGLPFRQAEFELGPPIEADSVAWPLRVEAAAISEFSVRAGGGSCGALITAAHIGIALELPEALVPYRHVLHYETLVDGAPWTPTSSLCDSTDPGRSWTDPPGTDSLYAGCKELTDTPDIEFVSPDWGLSPGSHEVVMRATLPGTTLTFESMPMQIELGCESPSTTEPEPEPELAEPTPSTAPEDVTPPPIAKTRSGCTAAPHATDRNAAWALLLLAWGIRRRRARSRARS